MKHYKTLKLRVKDKHTKELTKLATQVNFVWNYTKDLRLKVLSRENRFMSAYDVASYTKGNELDIHSQTVQAITEEYCLRSKQFKKPALRWRVSNKKSSKRSLGWIPFKKVGIKVEHGQVRYSGTWYSLWDSYGNLNDYNIKSGSFVEDARGRWYVCLVVEVEVEQSKGTGSIGIDLGLKDVGTTSEGEVITNPRFYRKYESKLGIAQRSKNKKRTRALHAKIANCRRDYLQKETTKLVKENGMIIVGNLSATALTASGSGKSVNDCGFAACRTMLRYKCRSEEHTSELQSL